VDEQWAVSVEGPIGDAVAAFAREPTWLYEGLCAGDYPIKPSGH
jgi:hypothetical protein